MLLKLCIAYTIGFFLGATVSAILTKLYRDQQCIERIINQLPPENGEK